MTPEELKSRFMGWQCRIRQYSVRRNAGRPTDGMRPVLTVRDQEVGPVTVQMVKSDSADVTREFRYLAKKTLDPQDRFHSAIRLLSEYYYQIPAEFDDELTAVYPLNSALADQIVRAGSGVLSFAQANQRYVLECSVRGLSEPEPKYQATYWHNCLFNSSMPGVVKVLGFMPRWQASTYRQQDIPT